MQKSEDLDRREFFRLGLRKAARTAVKEADSVAKKRARHWIRPPYALDELEFLMTCTRCGDCIEVCPHKVVFALPPRLGAQIVNTPALDLLHKGCHLCNDWPCVQACEPAALKITDEPTVVPQLAIASIDTQTCLPYTGPECGACANSCQITGALIWDGVQPSINSDICNGCALCREACIVEPKAIQIKT